MRLDAEYEHDPDHAGKWGSWDTRVEKLRHDGSEQPRPFDYTIEEINARRARRLADTYERMGV